MCDFISGVVTRKNAEGGEGRILFGNLASHKGIEDKWGLKPDTYREFEFQRSGLTVRVAQNDKSEAYYQALILAKFPTREAMLDGICRGDGFDLKQTALDWSKSPEIQTEDAARILPLMPNLTTLYCWGCAGLKALPKMPNLTTLYCGGCTGLKALPKMPNLTTLYCWGCGAPEGELRAMAMVGK
jgi:hypothetical protein